MKHYFDNETFHYPPELFNLLVETIPLLNRSKNDVLLFFRGAGVPHSTYQDISQRLRINRHDVSKYEITKTLLERLNARGDATLRERREIIRRVVQFENFDTCWPDDQLKAKGLAASVRDVVNQKDSFTRMRQERDLERDRHRAAVVRKSQERETKLAKIDTAKRKLYHLFSSEETPQSRGLKLEDAMNSLFAAYDILVEDSFHVVSPSGEGTTEQIDGAIEFQGHIYFVELKWYSEPIGKPLISDHLVTLMGRSEARGIFVSASGYTAPAIATCREFLQHKLIVLIHLEEIVRVLDLGEDLSDVLLAKVRAAQLHKNPYLSPHDDH